VLIFLEFIILKMLTFIDIANNTPGLQPTHTSIQWEPEALLPDIKRLGCEAKAEVEDERSYATIPYTP
jgi:hypothetical protein